MSWGVLREDGSRFLGYIRDTASKRALQKPMTELLAHLAPINIPSGASLAQYRLPIFLDQGASGSCTLGSTSHATYAALGAAGDPSPTICSQCVGYGIARSVERVPLFGGQLEPLEDKGAMLADVSLGWSRFGNRPMRVQTTPDGRFYDLWTSADVSGVPGAPAANVNEEPDFADLERAGETLYVGEYRIDETSSDVIDQVCATIAVARRPVVFGIFVDSQVFGFTASSSPIDKIDTSDPHGGLHALFTDKYETTSSGQRVFEVCNSWGSGYGDHGVLRLTDNALRQAFDVYGWTVRRVSPPTFRTVTP